MKVDLKQSGRNSERAAGLAGEEDEAGLESGEAGYREDGKNKVSYRKTKSTE